MARKKGIDWGKVAMFSAGGLILYAILRPQKAQAAKPTVPAPPAEPEPEPTIAIPRFTMEDGQCVDNADLMRPRFVDALYCHKCDRTETTDPFCYPPELRI